MRVEYQALPNDGVAPDADAMNTIRDIIERRVNSIGVSEPQVVTQGSDRVVVELPGESDENAIEQLVGQTGLLEFIPLPPAKYGTASTTTTGGPTGVTQGEPLPNDPTLIPLFGGSAVTSASAATDQNGLPVVAFDLSSDAASKFATYTTNNVGNFFAIVLDGTVVSAPSIQSPIPGGHGQITVGSGVNAQTEVNNLVTVLKYGSLPFKIQFVQGTTISATLGSTFLTQSLLGGGIGIALVFLFMLLYYRLPGLLADGALIYYSLVVYALFRLIPVTLTLAGIAGFVLSIGMAVDANILIFERTKEELRSGKSLVSVDRGGLQPGLELDPRLERVEPDHGLDPVQLRLVDDQGLRPGADHRRPRLDVHRDRGHPHGPALASFGSRSSSGRRSSASATTSSSADLPGRPRREARARV